MTVEKAVIRKPGGLQPGPNTITLPQALRTAIPHDHGERVLELGAIDGAVARAGFDNPVVHLNLHLRETGNLNGKFVLWADLQATAARALAKILTEMADRAGGGKAPR